MPQKELLWLTAAFRLLLEWQQQNYGRAASVAALVKALYRIKQLNSFFVGELWRWLQNKIMEIQQNDDYYGIPVVSHSLSKCCTSLVSFCCAFRLQFKSSCYPYRDKQNTHDIASRFTYCEVQKSSVQNPPRRWFHQPPLTVLRCLSNCTNVLLADCPFEIPL